MENWIEVANWGWNLLTFSAIGAVLITIYQGYGLWKQSREIRLTGNSESLSTFYFSYMLWYFLAFVYYGLSSHSLAMSFCGLLGFLYIPILIGIHKSRGFTLVDWLVLWLTLPILPLMIIVSDKDVYLMCLMAGILVSIIKQLALIIRTKDASALSLSWILAFLLAGILWLSYALTIGDWALIAFNSLASLLFAMILGCYLWYRPKVVR